MSEQVTPQWKMEEQQAEQCLNRAMEEFIVVDYGIRESIRKVYSEMDAEYRRHVDMVRLIHQKAQTDIHFRFLNRRREQDEQGDDSQFCQQRYSRFPKQLYVLVLCCPLGAYTESQARTDFLKLLANNEADAYGILIIGENTYYGCVAFTQEPLALFMDTKFKLRDAVVHCTHTFTETLRKVRRNFSPGEILEYRNPKTRMTVKSCNNYCLRNVLEEDDTLLDVVKELDRSTCSQ